jgi:predicted ATPase
LFVERARQRRPGFVVSDEAEATIAALCERLDRLPLAIELAAARVGVMSPNEILAGLGAHLGVLGGGSRLSPPRHRTVRATVEWSYELLDREQRDAFRNLAVFVGGFDADAALAVAPGLTLDVFARLVDKSVVTASESPRGRTRYLLLETVREYAHELLVAAGELDAARGRHLHHFSMLVGEAEAASSPSGWPRPTRPWACPSTTPSGPSSRSTCWSPAISPDRCADKDHRPRTPTTAIDASRESASVWIQR